MSSDKRVKNFSSFATDIALTTEVIDPLWNKLTSSILIQNSSALNGRSSYSQTFQEKEAW